MILLGNTYVAEVLVALRRIRETAIRGHIVSMSIDTSWSPRNLGARHFL